MKNIFLSIGGVLGAIVIGSLFLSDTSNDLGPTPTPVSQSQQESCRKLANEYETKQKRENPTITFLVPEFQYNQNLNTCIYSGGFISNNLIELSIINLYTNQQILVHGSVPGGRLLYGLSTESYNQEKARLFSSR